MQGLWQLPLKVPDILRHDLGPITKLFSQNHSSNIIEPPIPSPLLVQPTTSTLHPSYHTTDKHTSKPLQPVSPSSLSLHSNDFNITLLDETSKPSLKAEPSKKKSTLHYIQQAAWQLYKQDKYHGDST